MRRALLVLALSLAACSILSPQPDSSRFFTLSAVADGASAPSRRVSSRSSGFTKLQKNPRIEPR